MVFNELPVTFLGDDWTAFLALAPEQPDLPWLVWQSTRNALIESLRPFGTIGPMDAFPLALAVLEKDESKVMKAWPAGAEDPDFYVIDDQSTHAPLHRVEINETGLLTQPLLEALWRWAQAAPGWCVELAFADFSLQLRQDGIWTGGEALRACRAPDDLLRVR